MRVALKYRLYPSNAHESTLNYTLGICRDVYNSLVNERAARYDTTGNSPNYHDQATAITQWKQDHLELRNVHSQVLQNVSVRVDLAFQAFFRRLRTLDMPGYPRMKGPARYDSFTYPLSGFKVGDSTATLSKIGNVKAKIHRPLAGNVKTCTVRRYGRKWYVCFACEYEPAPLPPSDLSVGIDMGLTSFMARSDGTFVENPRFFRRDEKALATASRAQAKTPTGSCERRKRNRVLSRVHVRIRNRRHDFVRQCARRIVNKFGVIAVEKLSVSNMLGNHGLAKTISDASWSMYRSILTHKAETAGREIWAVNPAYTSQDCHACGYRAKKKLSDRWHSCPICGASLDRDMNAAINILQTAVGRHSDR